MCAEIVWPDPPLTMVANNFEVHFFDTASGEPAKLVPKFYLTLWNHYESRWAVPPDVSRSKDFGHIHFVTNLFFDTPGYWKVFLHLEENDITSSVHMKVHLEDM